MMHKVEYRMVEAIKAGKPMKSGNTEVTSDAFNTAVVKLYGSPIARTRWIPGQDKLGWEWTLAGFNTKTTRSRINALSNGLGWGFTIGNVKGIPTVRYHNYTGPRSSVFQVSDTEWVEA